MSHSKGNNPDRSTDRRAKSWWSICLLIATGSATGFLLVEIGARVTELSYLPHFSTADRDRGRALRPGAAGWYRAEGEAFVEINSDGLRDQEHSIANVHETYRIAVLGDSFAAAFQIPVQKTFWSIMAAELAQCEALAGQPVEAINFGVNGYSTAQELITLRQHVWKYSPQLVLLAFFTGNDVSENSFALTPGFRPYFVIHNGRLVLDRSHLGFVGYFLRRVWRNAAYHSRTLQAINAVRRNRRLSFSKRELDSLRATNGHTSEPGLSTNIYKEPEGVWHEAWQVTEGLLVAMKTEVEQQNAKFLVSTLSNPIQVHPSQAFRSQIETALNVPNLFYADNRIKALGAREGFIVLGLAEPMADYAESNKIYLHGFDNAILGEGHWNETGHQIAGQLLADDICRELS